MGGVGLIEPLDRRRGLRVGRLAVTTAGRQLPHAPRVDGGTLTLQRDGADLGEAYGGLVVRYGRQLRGEPQVAALVVAWRGARVPTPWWPPRRAWQLARAWRARRHGQLPQPRGFNFASAAYDAQPWADATTTWPDGGGPSFWSWPHPAP